MKLALLMMSAAVSALVLSACGDPQKAVPAGSPATTAAVPPAPPKPEPVAAPAATPAAPEPAPVPVKEAEAEKCDGGWVCVQVSLATRKVEKRETKLLGDPKIESTWSKTSDGRTVTFDDFSQGPLELTLKRLPNNKIEVLVKLAKGGAPITIDKHDGSPEQVTHVGAIATEKDGLLLVDLRYQR
jgi:hypothetical protein